MNRFRRFISELWSELKKVTWPSRITVRNLTILVFVISFVVGLYITILDTGYDYIIRWLSGLTV